MNKKEIEKKMNDLDKEYAGVGQQIDGLVKRRSLLRDTYLRLQGQLDVLSDQEKDVQGLVKDPDVQADKESPVKIVK